MTFPPPFRPPAPDLAPPSVGDRLAADLLAADLAAAGDLAVVDLAAEQAVFDEEVAAHDRSERRLLWREVTSIVFVVLVVIARQLWLT